MASLFRSKKLENNKTREVKIFPRDINTNQKKSEPGVSFKEPGGSLLKKNEFTMILIAALVVTALVFFFFSGDHPSPRLLNRRLSLYQPTKPIRSSRGLRIASPPLRSLWQNLPLLRFRIKSKSHHRPSPRLMHGSHELKRT